MTARNTKFIAAQQISSKKTGKCRNKGNTELYCLVIAADNIVDAISFCSVIRKQVLPKCGSGSGFGRIWVLKPDQVRLRQDLK